MSIITYEQKNKTEMITVTSYIYTQRPSTCPKLDNWSLLLYAFDGDNYKEVGPTDDSFGEWNKRPKQLWLLENLVSH